MRRSLAAQAGGVAFAALVVWFAAASAIADEPPKLRYGFQKGQKYAYDITVTLKSMDLQESWKGTLVYDISESTGNQFVAKVVGRLSENVQGGGRLPFPMRGMPFGPHRFIGVQMPGVWTLSRLGEVVIVGPVNQIPCLLGPEELLVIEPLPKDAKMSWAINQGIGVLERGGAPAFGPPRTQETGHGAGEQIEFAVTKTTPDTVQLTKKYHLATAASVGGETQLTMSGAGELTFDRKRGLFTSNTTKYEIQLGRNDAKLNIPVTLTYRAMTDKELAEKEQKDKEKAAAIVEANRPKPIDAKERASLLKDLRSRDKNRCQAALRRFSKAVVDDHPEAISAALTPFLHYPDDFVQADAARALMVWATSNAESALIATTKSENWMARGPAIEALGRVRTPTAAEAVAAQMHRNRGEAGKALRAMGPTAESATLAMVKEHDFWTRNEALNVLKEIGGQKTLTALRREIIGKNGNDKRELEEVINAVKFNISQGGGDADAAEPAATNEPAGESESEPASKPAKSTAKTKDAKVRTWTDASGSFNVEAEFVGVAEGKVLLKKSTGRVLRVPLDKLSDEDQTWVKEHPQPKAENPFE